MNRIVGCFRNFSAQAARRQKLKVTICGAAGSIGRIVSYCLKTSLHDLHLSLFDTSTDLKPLADQITLINTPNTIEEHIGPLKLRQSLKNSNIVVVVARQKPNVTTSRQPVRDTFEANFPIVCNIGRCCMEICPEAVLAVATNPINSIIPAMNELFTLQGYQHSHKIMGVTATDLMQACMVYAAAFNLEPSDVYVPLTGGTTLETIAPIFSQAAVANEDIPVELSISDSERLHTLFLHRKKQAFGSEFVNAHAISQFVESIVRALKGEEDIVETAFVAAPDEARARYMISMIDLDRHGIETVYGPPENINRAEKKILYPSMLNLQRDINMGETHAQGLAKANLEMRMWK